MMDSVQAVSRPGNLSKKSALRVDRPRRGDRALEQPENQERAARLQKHAERIADDIRRLAGVRQCKLCLKHDRDRFEKCNECRRRRQRGDEKKLASMREYQRKKREGI